MTLVVVERLGLYSAPVQLKCQSVITGGDHTHKQGQYETDLCGLSSRSSSLSCNDVSSSSASDLLILSALRSNSWIWLTRRVWEQREMCETSYYQLVYAKGTGPYQFVVEWAQYKAYLPHLGHYQSHHLRPVHRDNKLHTHDRTGPLNACRTRLH